MDPATDRALPDQGNPPPAFDAIVRDELIRVKQLRAEVMAPSPPSGVERLVLALCLMANVVFYLLRDDYFGLFIAASFYLNMYYFITLIIPTKFEKKDLPAAEFQKLHQWLKEIGIPSGTARFTRLFTNAVLLNSRALTRGVGAIFCIDIVFSLLLYRDGLPLGTTLIVIAQCLILVTFYLLVRLMEPFSAEYAKRVERVKERMTRRHLPAQLVTGLFLFGFVLAICLFLATIIFLPGLTLSAFISQSELAGLAYLFAYLTVLAVSQYFLIRAIHGATSRAVAERIFEYRTNALYGLLAGPAPSGEPAGEGAERSALLLETRIFMVRRNTLAGLFPVFVVDLDLSVLMDSTSSAVIRGYIVENPRG